MTATLPSVKVTDIPGAQPIAGLAIVGQPQVKETERGVYVTIVVPLHYFADATGTPTKGVKTEHLIDAADSVRAAYSNGGDVNEALRDLGLRTFTARWNVKPEWFDPAYGERVRQGALSDNETRHYNMNMSGLTRGFFAAAGTQTTDVEFTAFSIVGFRARPDKQDASRLTIGNFYPAPKVRETTADVPF